MSIKAYRETARNPFRLYKVTGHELLVIMTDEAKVSIHTGGKDIHGKHYLAIDITKHDECEFEPSHKIPQTYEIIVRERKEPA